MNAPANMVIVLACSKKKVTAPRCAAGELYLGAIFTKGKDIAEQAGLPIRILSAKYGFLHPDAIVDNYDEKFKKPFRGEWPQAPWHGFFLGGQLYFKHAPKSFITLVPSLPMGYMLKALTELQHDPETMQKMMRRHPYASIKNPL